LDFGEALGAQGVIILLNGRRGKVVTVHGKAFKSGL
jgi:hypothetical protein